MAKQKILLIRTLDVGDVLSIGLPALRYLKSKFPEAELSCLSFAEGAEVIALAEPQIKVITIQPEQWPEQLLPAMEGFLGLAEQIIPENYEQIINLDTAFMPCLLARFLKDAGEPVTGNFMSISVQQLLDSFQNQSLQPSFVQQPADYMQSTFFTMSAWFTRWWDGQTRCDYGYAEYYLRHCCGFEPLDVDMHLPVSVSRSNNGHTIALYFTQSDDGYSYPYQQTLATGLRQRGFEVLDGLDKQPLKQRLVSLAKAEVVICKGATARWLAQAVNSKTLLLAGACEPKTLMPDYATEPTAPCPRHSQSQSVQASLQPCLCEQAEDVVESVISLFAEQT